MRKGEIYYSKNTINNPHPIVCLEDTSKDTFKGAVISTKAFGNNVIMDETHFLKKDDNGNPYKVVYGPSYLIYDKFIKTSIETNEKKVGNLSVKGLAFVEMKLKDIEPDYFPRHIKDRNLEQNTKTENR